MIYKYKYTKACSVCKFCRRHPAVKEILLNTNIFNPKGFTPQEAIDHYKFPLTYSAITNHCRKHIYKLETGIEHQIINDKEPIRKVMGSVIQKTHEAHEGTLDEFINQFDEAVRNRELKMTVKDGLQAIKIKADIIKSDKDRKKDILKQMIGASGEQRRPAERETAEE